MFVFHRFALVSHRHDREGRPARREWLGDFQAYTHELQEEEEEEKKNHCFKISGLGPFFHH